MISGEPVPVAKSAGPPGRWHGEQTWRLQLPRHQGRADTVLAQIVRMVEQAQGAKLPIQALVDR